MNPADPNVQRVELVAAALGDLRDQPVNNLSVRELAEEMLKLAVECPEYSTNAKKVKLLDTTADEY